MMRPPYFWAVVTVFVLAIVALWIKVTERAPLRFTATSQPACEIVGNIHMTISSGCNLTEYSISQPGYTPKNYALSGGNFDIIDLKFGAGDYIIVVNDDCGRISSKNVSVENARFEITYNISPPNSFTSNDGEIEIIPNRVGTYEYSWNFNPSLNSRTAKNLGPGFYMVTVTNSHSCTRKFLNEIRLIPEYGAAECLDWKNGNDAVKPMNATEGCWLYNCAPGSGSIIPCGKFVSAQKTFTDWMTAYLVKNSSGLIIGDCGNSIRFINPVSLYNYENQYFKTGAAVPPASNLPAGSVTDPPAPAPAEINKLAAELIALAMNIFQVDEISSTKPTPQFANTAYLAEPFKYQMVKDIYYKINHALGCGEIDGVPATPAQYEEMYQVLKNINDKAYYVACYK